MCEYCHNIPHLRGCPNEDLSPWEVYKCVECDEPIYDGDDYVETTKGKMHLECLTNHADKQMLELVGVEVETAHIELPE